MLSRRLAKLMKKKLAPALPGPSARRYILKKCLKVMQKYYAAGVVQASVGPRERRRLDMMHKLFAHDQTFSEYFSRKKVAPGGSPIGKVDVKFGDVTAFYQDGTPAYSRARARYRRALSKIFKLLDVTSLYDGNSYYRFHNALLIQRFPDSSEEFFSHSRRRLRRLYNPYIIKFFSNHRF